MYEVNLELDKMNAKISEFEKQIEGVEKKKMQKLSEQSSTLEEIRKLQARIQNIEKELKLREAKIEELDELDRSKRNEIENISKNIIKIKASLEKLNRNFGNLSENILKANADLPKKEAELLQVKLKEDKLEKSVNAREAEIFEKTQMLQVIKRELEAQLDPYETKINQSKFTIEQNNSTISLLSENWNKQTQEISQVQKDQESLSVSISEKKANLDQLNNKQSEISVLLEKTNSDLKAVQTAESGIYKNIVNLQVKISEIRQSNSENTQRNANLDKLMRAQEQGILSGIYGRLGNLGSIESEYDVAITTSCSHLNSVVVEKIDNATKAVEFLRSNNLGRMTFIVLEKQFELESKMNNFNPVPECKRLFDLVKIKNQRLASAFYFALKDTLVCKDLATASKIAYGAYRYRTVTLSGELIETSGTMSGGGKPRRGGMSSKIVDDASNIEYLNKLQAEYEEMAKEFNVKKSERLALESKRNSLSQNIQELKLHRNQLENELGMQEKQLSDFEKRLKVLQKEMEKQGKNQESIKKLQAHNAQLGKTVEDLIQESFEFCKGLEKNENEINKISGEDHKRNKEELKSMKKSSDEIEKAIIIYKNINENAPAQIQKCKEEIENKESSIKQNEAVIEKIKKEMEEIEKYAEETYGQMELLNREKNNMQTSNTEVDRAIRTLKDEIRKIVEEKEKIVAEMNEVKNDCKKLEKKENNIEEENNKNKANFKKFMEEYGFIDEFENEINRINSQRNENEKEDGNKMNIEVDEEEVTKKGKENANNANNKMDIEVEIGDTEEEIDINFINEKGRKIPKIANNYKKFIDQKYLNYRFRAEELEELYKYKVKFL